MGPITTYLCVPPAVRHRHQCRFYFSRASPRVKLACSAVLLDHPQVEATARSIRDKPAGCIVEEQPANSLSGALGSDVEIVQERAEGRILVWENTGKPCQLSIYLRKDCKNRLGRFFR